MAEKYPIDMSKVNPGEFAEWANEGLELSQAFVYNGKFLRTQKLTPKGLPI